MPNTFQRTPRAASILGLLALGAACTELGSLPQTDAPLPSAATPDITLLCTAHVQQESVSCSAPRIGANRLIYGGQGVYVRLSSSNAAYNAGTETFSVEVTVENLFREAIGTPDGVTPDAEGIRVFFHQAPVGDNAEVTVANADGTDSFTGGDQPYFTYSEILAQNAISAPRTWQFSVPAGVNTFSFQVAIDAELQYRLVINEVLANPGGTITDASGEWFEIYNAGSRSVDLQGLVIADSAASGRRPYHLISSSVVVPAGGYVVLGNTTNTTNNGGVPVDYAYGSAMALANSLDAVKIARVVGSDTLTLDRTQYSSAALSAQNGISRELVNPELDNSNMDGSNWGDALVTAVYGPGGRGTPKAQNSTFTP